MKILYEPWNLGDAIIAASVAYASPDTILLACNSKWHEVLTIISHGSLRLLPLDLPYVWRARRGWLDLGDTASLTGLLPNPGEPAEVISIRGDFRDLIAAHRSFGGARFRFSGWFPYFARWSRLLDLPYRSGMLTVRNRYRAWAQAAGVPFQELERRRVPAPRPGKPETVVIHVGAQWRSRQYPRVAQLARLLESAGHRVEILGGPQDTLPPELLPDSIQRPLWPELVDTLRRASFVITNDSGPMHLAAFLGCRTVALSRCSNIAEWLPPGARAISSPAAPKGYRPDRGYWSDAVLSEWPGPEEVAGFLEDWKRRGSSEAWGN